MNRSALSIRVADARGGDTRGQFRSAARQQAAICLGFLYTCVEVAPPPPPPPVLATRNPQEGKSTEL
jgi:hypothetical protein